MADNQEFQEEMTAAEAEQAFGNVTDAQAIEQYTRYHQYEEATRKMAVAERRKLREKTEARRIQVAKLPLDVDPYDSRTWTSKYRHTCETILEYDQKINTLRRQMDGHFLESGGYRKMRLGIKPWYDTAKYNIQLAKQAQRDNGQRTSSEERADRKEANRRRDRSYQDRADRRRYGAN